MRRSLVSVSCLAASFVLVACSSSDPAPATDGGVATDATAPDATSAIDGAAPLADGGADAAFVEKDCFLRDDSGGPGQYTDSCVRREWIAPYAGTYTSAACELVVSITGSVAATFTMKVVAGPAAGTYPIAWDGGTGAGNDSYYRFTTDASFATTKTLNFNAGEPVGASDERNASLRVEEIDKGAPVYKGRFQSVVGGKPEEVDCGTFTRR